MNAGVFQDAKMPSHVKKERLENVGKEIESRSDTSKNQLNDDGFSYQQLLLGIPSAQPTILGSQDHKSCPKSINSTQDEKTETTESFSASEEAELSCSPIPSSSPLSPSSSRFISNE